MVLVCSGCFFGFDCCSAVRQVVLIELSSLQATVSIPQ